MCQDSSSLPSRPGKTHPRPALQPCAPTAGPRSKGPWVRGETPASQQPRPDRGRGLRVSAVTHSSPFGEPRAATNSFGDVQAGPGAVPVPVPVPGDVATPACCQSTEAMAARPRIPPSLRERRTPNCLKPPPPAGTANGLARAPCSGRRGRVQSPRTGGETGRRKATHHKANGSAQAHSGQNPAWRSPRPLSFPSPPRERARGRGTGARSNLPPPPPPPPRALAALPYLSREHKLQPGSPAPPGGRIALAR